MGAPLTNFVGAYSGVAYGYEKINNQWVFDQAIRPTDLNTQDRFGSVKLYKGNLYAGSRDKELYGGERGALYYFIKNDSSWEQIQKIIPKDTLPMGSNFGRYFDVGDSFLFVSAQLDTMNGTQSGSVYVFKQVNGIWVQHQKLFPSSGIPYQRFGNCITHNKSYLFIGAPEEDNINGEYAGAVYVYELVDTLWVEKEKIINKNGDAYELFGDDVSVSDNTLAIGMPGSVLSNIPGRVFIYDIKDGIISLSAEIMASNSELDDYFGGVLILRKDSILIGAPGSNQIVQSAGAFYLFNFINGEWREKEIFTASDADLGDNLGFSVDMHEGHYAGGAPRKEDQNGNGIGVVYIFQDSPTSIDDNEIEPEKFYLFQNYPNPFNPVTKISYALPSASTVDLKIYNVLGQLITTLVNEEKPAGFYEVDFNAADLPDRQAGLPSGVYMYRITAGDYVQTKKMLLLK